MTTKTIKSVDDEVWYKFRFLAVKNRLGMGKLLGEMINEYEFKSKEFWKEILEGERLLTDKEASELLSEIKKSRKEHGFRK